MQSQPPKHKKIKQNDLLKIICALLLGAFYFVLARFGVIAIPCLFKSLFQIPCPGCGLTRASLLLFEFRFIEAIQMNIISVPLFLGMVTIIFSIFVELLFNKPALSRLKKLAQRKETIAIIIIMTSVSWTYNIVSNT